MHRPTVIVHRFAGRAASAAAPFWLSLTLFALGGCGSNAAKGRDPAQDARSYELASRERRAAVDALWSAGQDRPEETREALKKIVWDSRAPQDARLRALELLADDPADPGSVDTRRMLALMLPLEPDRGFIAAAAGRAVQGNWVDLTPALVRVYARPWKGRPDDERDERRALEALHPGQPIETTLYQVFAAPATGVGPARDRAERTRAAAWEGLTRLDPDGSKLAGLLARPALAPEGAQDDRLIVDLRAVLADFGCVPVTASQLRWLGELRRFEDPADGAARRAWWNETKVAVATLRPDQRQGLAMRHLEPVRWAAANRPELLRQDRESILGDLRASLRGRATYLRSGRADTETASPSASLADWESRLAWPDLLAITVVDHALRSPGLADEFWRQAQRDMRDTSTEHGGLLESTPGADGFRATVFPPRANQRLGDDRFVASDELLAHGGWALAHYHFHAQRIDNQDYAGPGPGDAEFAAQHGRTCLVLTPVRDRQLNVDYYHPGGATIDLGTLRAADTNASGGGIPPNR